MSKNPGDSTSITLIKGVIDGDPAAEEKFVEIYQTVIQKLIYSKTTERRSKVNDVEDLTQDVFYRIFRFLGSFVRDPPVYLFRKWLATVVRNTIADAHSRGTYAPESLGGDSEQRFSQVEDNCAKLTETTLRDSKFQSHVAKAMRKVERVTEPIHWRVFLRSTIDERSSGDVALEMGLTAANVRKINQRVKEAIVAELCEPT